MSSARTPHLPAGSGIVAMGGDKNYTGVSSLWLLDRGRLVFRVRRGVGELLVRVS